MSSLRKSTVYDDGPTQKELEIRAEIAASKNCEGQEKREAATQKRLQTASWSKYEKMILSRKTL